jgi:CheY-like chemotaxis protein
MTATANSISIVMFDDQNERQSKAELLEEQTGFTVQFVDLQNKEVIKEVEQAIAEFTTPKMVLVDHILDKAIADSVIHKGTSIVPLLREQWPNAPIIAVTAAYEDCVNDINSEVYEDVIPIEWFSRFVAYVPTVIGGYDELTQMPHDMDSLFSLMNVPDSETEAIRTSVPSAMKRRDGEPSFSHRVFRWFRRSFYRKPGFLLDRAWTALTVGVAKEHLSRYEDRILEAQYGGVFADPDDPRWWKARLYEYLLPDSRQRFSVSLCEAAKARLKISDSHASKCYRCGEKWPEVMGFVDESTVNETAAEPLHLRCSRSDARFTSEPFYEERRVMLDDE